MVGQSSAFDTVNNASMRTGTTVPIPVLPGVDTGAIADFKYGPTHGDEFYEAQGGSWDNDDFTDYTTRGHEQALRDIFLEGANNYSGSSKESEPTLGDSLSEDQMMNYWEGLFASVGRENVLNRIYNAEQAALARQFSSDEAQKSRDWSEKMSNSSYQRMVADLEKAGLNPILAYSQGGSSTPNSAVAQSSSASYNVGGGDTFSDLLNAFSHLISSASDVVASIIPF